MKIHWDSLLAVFVVSLSSTVAVVVLVSLALLGLSARTAQVGRSDASARSPLFSPTVGTAVAGVCLAAAAVIVLVGLWALITR